MNYSTMKPAELLAAINRLREEWDPRDRNPFSIRGGRYMVGAYGSLSRAEVIDQCGQLEAGMQEHHDEQAAQAIREGTPHGVIVASLADQSANALLFDALRNLPRFVRMQALAFHGIKDDEVAA